MRMWILTASFGLLVLVACSNSTTESDPTGPEYLDYSTPDNLVANFVAAWEAMDFSEYERMLYDGEELGTVGEAHDEFQFHFIFLNDEYGEFWRVEAELAHTAALFSGLDAIDGSPGVKSVSLRFDAHTVWSRPVTVPGSVERPEGMLARTYATDLIIGRDSYHDYNDFQVRDTVDFYVIPVEFLDSTEFRLWKWVDVEWGRFGGALEVETLTWSELKPLYR